MVLLFEKLNKRKCRQRVICIFFSKNIVRVALFLILAFVSIDILSSLESGDPQKQIFFHDTAKKVSAGYAQLKWKLSESAFQNHKQNKKTTNSQPIQYILQQSSLPDFSHNKTIYRGPDRASFVSGLSEGTHFFRVRAYHPDSSKNKTSWSNSHSIEVSYHSWALTWTLFFMGAFLFIVLVVLLIIGSRKNDLTT